MKTSLLTKWRRLSSELHDYLSAPIAADAAVNDLRTGLVQRTERFLTILRDQVYGVPDNPYSALLRAARVTFDQLVNWVERDGVESTLGRLAAEGVWLSVDEFKGRRPIRRGPLELNVGPGSFDPPSSTVGFQALGGQSRSRGTPSSVSFALLTEEAAHLKVLLSQLGAERRPILNWRPILPASAGTKFALRFAKIGCPLDAWWSHVPVALWSSDRGRWRTRLIVYLARLNGVAIPHPEYVPLNDATRVVRWIREQQRRDVEPLIFTYAGSAVRVCAAARSAGHSLKGVHFFVGGESLTAVRAALIHEVGATVSTTYGLSEAGSVAVGCIEPAAPDDMHLLLNRVALVQTPRSSAGEKRLLLTTLSPHAPKILLNVETGDTGVLTERPCGCSFGRIGFTTHLSDLTSYEKLTAEGMTFLASDVSAIVEQLLPAAFGGAPTDYQFVREIAVNGLARLRLRVSPRLGTMDETQVLAVVLKELQRRSPQSARVWNDARVIRIERAEPVPTVMGKLFPLHVIESSRDQR